MSFPSLCRMHRSTCERLGPRTALRFKRFGMFHDVSWASYRDRADAAAAGLLDLGVQHGDRVAILAENRVEWPIADHAILSVGAADVPLHAPLAARQVEYQVGHSQSRGIIVSGQEQADKVFAVLSELPNLEFLISFDPINAPKTTLTVLSWDGLIQRGRQSKKFAKVREVEGKVSGEDLATIIYTSGTTGNPKGVMLTHANLLSNVEATLSLSEQQSSDILLSWLPYSHIYARTIDLYVTAQSGATLALAESMDTLVINLAEIQPTWMTAVPRFYEKVWSRVEHLPPEQQKEKLWKIFGPRLKHLSSGGAPLPKHICKAFTEVGLPLLEGYGLTETSPVISFNSLDSNRIGTVGKAIPGVEVRIASDGEILTRGPHVMRGYWRNPEATAEAIRDGWFHTGDVGSIDADGYLSITDRKKDLFITSAGKNIAPSELERLLIGDIYIDQAVVYGDGRRFVSALIVPNFEHLSQKAKELKCDIASSDGFITSTVLLNFLDSRIAAVMQNVSQPERVKKFLVLDRPFQLADDELTATLKVRRSHLIGKYEQQLAALYED